MLLLIMPYYAQILGHLKTINFTFGTNGNLRALGVPIFKRMSVMPLPGSTFHALYSNKQMASEMKKNNRWLYDWKITSLPVFY